ncbi:hypothetical protein [Rhizorhabdus argentea]|uniref:hypothetical protein n=1 Tax=Rhizorhabdus argentea TaxID=1387174 RepID=UPI0030EF71E2
MFWWKNAIVLIGLLGLASLPLLRLSQASWERLMIARLAAAGALIACVAVSFVPMAPSLLIYGVLLLLCFDRRVPMVATFLFFYLWTPSTTVLLNIAGAYVMNLGPLTVFSGAMLLAYLANPGLHLRRQPNATDVLFHSFLLIFLLCVSLPDSPTGAFRNFMQYVVPYGLTYHVVSRTRIPQPELVLRLMIFGAAAASLLCMFEAVRWWPLYANIGAMKGDLYVAGTPTVMLFRGGMLRAYGPYSHPLGGSVVFGMTAIAVFGLAAWQGWKMPVVVAGGCALVGLVATLSRTGVIAMAVGIVALLLMRRRYAVATAIAGFGFIIVVALPILSNADAQGSADYRMMILWGIPKTLGSHVWLGYPEAVSSGLLDSFKQGQGIVDLVNLYLAIVVQGGIASLLPYVLFLASSLMGYRALRRVRPSRDQLLLGQVCMAIQAGFVVSAAFIGAWSAPMVLSIVFAAILVALRAEAVRAAAHPSQPRTDAGEVRSSMPHMPDGDRLPALR